MDQQLDLLKPTISQQFDAWIHTPEGGKVANWFIRLALGCKARGMKRIGARMIWERLRWHYAVTQKRDGENYRLNDHYPPYLVRFAVARVPELEGMFELRELGKERKKRKVIIIEEEPKAA